MLFMENWQGNNDATALKQNEGNDVIARCREGGFAVMDHDSRAIVYKLDNTKKIIQTLVLDLSLDLPAKASKRYFNMQ